MPELLGVEQPDLVLLNDDDLTFALIEARDGVERALRSRALES